MISRDVASTKAEEVRNEIAYYEQTKKVLLLSMSVIRSFEGKIYNARFTNALDEAVKHLDGTYRFGATQGYEFGVRCWLKKYQHISMVYSFKNFNGGLSEIRVYNRETQLTDKTVELFTLDNGKLRIKSEGWETLFNSEIDLIEERIKMRMPYTSADFVYEAYREKEKLEAEVRAIENKISNVVPSFLR